MTLYVLYRRFLLGGLVLVGVKTGFKPLFYLVGAPFLEGAQGRALHRQRSQKAQRIEVLYKVTFAHLAIF